MSFYGFDKIAPIATALSLSAMIISRAPTLINEFSALGFKFNINVGYVVLFSIPTIMFLLLWLWITRDLSVLERKPYINNRWLVSIQVFFMAFASFFMFVQFLTEFSPQGECNKFFFLRYFWDVTLWALKPEYCFSDLDYVQEYMPYIYPPLQTWVYLSFVGVCVAFSIKLWRFYKPNKQK